jgi:uncharacterized membrane-anchored protein YhcB (DUF1043 family)
MQLDFEDEDVDKQEFEDEKPLPAKKEKKEKKDKKEKKKNKKPKDNEYSEKSGGFFVNEL